MGNVTTDFITATKKIHADVRGLLTSLHLIREDVKVIREHAVEASNKERSDQHANDTNAIVTGGHVTNTNDPRGKEAEPASKVKRGFRKFKKKLWRDILKPKTYLEFAALVFLILYTCETKRTNDLTSTALQNAKDQFRVDQRPYITLAPPGEGPYPIMIAPSGQHAGHLVFQIHLANYGKSPAIETGRDARFAVGSESARQIEMHEPTDRMEHVTPQGAKPFFYIYSDELVSKQTFDAMQAGKFLIIIYGHVDYTDTFSAPKPHYVSEFCSAIIVPTVSDMQEVDDDCKNHNRME